MVGLPEGGAAPDRPTGRTRPRVAITYCTQCQWLLRAAWMAQELLSTFRDDLGEVALIPGAGGVFRIEIGDDVAWERVRDGGFPDVKALKQRVRDRIAPGRDLGHVDAVNTDRAKRDGTHDDARTDAGAEPA